MAESSLNLRISADTTDASAKLAIMRANLRAVEADTRSLTNQMRAVGAEGSGALVGGLEKVTREGTRLRSQISGLKEELGALGHAMGGIHEGGIATATREFRALFDELSSGRTRQTPGTLAIIASRVFGLGPAALAAVGGVAALAFALFEIARSASAAKTEIDNVQRSMIMIGRGADFSMTGATAQVKDLERNFRLTRTEAAELLATIQGIPRISEQTRGQVAGLAVAFADLSGKEMTPVKAAEELGKAFDSGAAGAAHLNEIFRGTLFNAEELERLEKAKSGTDNAAAEVIMRDALNRRLADQVNYLKEAHTYSQRVGQSVLENISGKGGPRIVEPVRPLGGAAPDQGAIQTFDVEQRYNKTLLERQQIDKDLITLRNALANATTADARKEIEAEIEEAQRRRESLDAKQGGSQIEQTRDRIAKMTDNEKLGQQQRLEIAVEEWRKLLDGGKLNAKERLEADREFHTASVEAIRTAAATEREVEKSDADTAITLSKMRLQVQKDSLDSEVDQGRITAAQKLAIERDLTTQMAQLDIAEREKELRDLSLTPAEYERIFNEIRILKEKLTEDLAALDVKASEDSKRELAKQTEDWKQVFGQIDSAMDTFFNDVITKQKKTGIAFEQAVAKMLTSWTEDIAKMLVQWIAFEAAVSVFGQGSSISKAINPFGPSATGIAGLIGGALGQGGSGAGAATTQLTTALTGTTAAVQQNTGGILNWVSQGIQSLAQMLGLTTATTADATAQAADTTATTTGLIPAVLANTIALGANTAALGVSSVAGAASGLGGLGGAISGAEKFLFPSFAVGAYSVPRDMIAEIHQGEMILPKADATVARSGAGAGAGSTAAAAGAPTSLAVNFSVNAVNGKDVVATISQPLVLRQLAKNLNSYMAANPSARSSY